MVWLFVESDGHLFVLGLVALHHFLSVYNPLLESLFLGSLPWAKHLCVFFLLLKMPSLSHLSRLPESLPIS